MAKIFIRVEVQAEFSKKIHLCTSSIELLFDILLVILECTESVEDLKALADVTFAERGLQKSENLSNKNPALN